MISARVRIVLLDVFILMHSFCVLVEESFMLSLLGY